RPSFTLKVSRTELEQCLGSPHSLESEPGGAGRVERWSFRCDCDLELVVDYSRQSQAASVWLDSLEVEHALAHMHLNTHHVLWRRDAEEFLSLDGWGVVRQDEHGHRHDICVLPVQEHARCLAEQLEARAHKQSYDVEARGTPPRRVRSRQGWAVIRQDAHGNRYQVAVHGNERAARRDAQSYELQPRREQSYVIEPMAEL
ncbi:MAG TPA: hypothetical protein VF794_20065, partial [Archangium sp.]|uniref:hypothetical protein n=1 Tax=Archangium sp. TaxID=1872627 RepID=UPI002ED8061F